MRTLGHRPISREILYSEDGVRITRRIFSEMTCEGVFPQREERHCLYWSSGGNCICAEICTNGVVYTFHQKELSFIDVPDHKHQHLYTLLKFVMLVEKEWIDTRNAEPPAESD